MVVLLLGVLGGMAAIAVDLGSYSAHRRDMQNAADAIALAAAQELPNGDDVQATADEWAERNGIDPADVTATVTPQSSSQPNPEVRVEVAEAHNFAFAPLVGIMSADVEAAAAAIKTSLGGHAQLVPWAVEEEVKVTTDPGDAIVLKYDSNNVETGNFGAIRIDGEGASVYGEAIQHGSGTTLCATGAEACEGPSQVSTQTGNMVGQTRNATDYRIDNTDPACDTWDEVVSDDGSGSMGLKTECNPFIEGGNPDSMRVIVLPIIASL